MIVKLIEATNFYDGGVNWGKFALMKFDEAEWSYEAVEAQGPLLSAMPSVRKWGDWNRETTVIVFDLQIGEGARVDLRGHPHAELSRHRIHVCPLFEPFLVWLFRTIQEREPGPGRFDISTLPSVAKFPAASAFAGHRRDGTV